MRIGADGDGIGALPDGTSVYLAATLPGETVLAHLESRRGEGWVGDVVAMVAASSERIEPACPHFASCGGCVLQHWRDVPYRAWKAGLLEAALRPAGFSASVAPLLTRRRGRAGAWIWPYAVREVR